MNRVLAVGIAICLLFVSSQSQSCDLKHDKNNVKNSKVLILGGGIAGITAARTLEVNGIDFIILEAGKEIGGRIRSDSETGVELGASWIHGVDPYNKARHPLWREWMNCNDGYGPNGSPTPYPTSVYSKNKQDFIDITEFESELERFVEIFENIEQEADDAPISTSMREKLTEKDWVPISALQNFTEWVVVDFCIATKPENLSVPLYYHLAYTDFLGSEDGVADDYLVTDIKGYNFVVECLATKFMEEKVKLDSQVTEIKWNDDCVCATVNGNEQYCGEYAIMTFSIGVLQDAIRGRNTKTDVTFDPELPQRKKDAILDVPMVYYARVYLIFNEITFLNTTDDYQQVIGYVSNYRGYYPVYIHDRHHSNVLTVDVTGDLALCVEEQEPNITQAEIMEFSGKCTVIYQTLSILLCLTGAMILFSVVSGLHLMWELHLISLMNY